MQINVSQLLQEPIGSIREFKVDEAVDIFGDGKKYGVSGSCRLLRTQRSILTSCILDTEVELTCSRCLDTFRLPLKLKFEEEYFPTVEVSNGAPLTLPDEPGIFTINAHHILDLTEATRQYAVMANPMKPLCRKDCAGLCQRCGQNLNLGQCECPRQEIDSRWSALTQLK